MSGPRFEPTWESLRSYQTPEWYLDAKFGIFIHWGAYSVPAFGNEWYPRAMYVQGSKEFEHHAATYGPQSSFGYRDFLPQFRAERFDADDWARLFRDSGAKYVVPVAEHHDGFAMYDSRLSNWTAAKMGPRRDVTRELADAARSQGLVFGVSSHRAEHWWFMNGGREFDSDVRSGEFEEFYGPARSEKEQPDEAFLEDWLARCIELVDAYRPQVFWFDWWIEQPAFEPYLRRFAAYYYNRGLEWGVGVAINYKNEAFPRGAAVFDVERGQLGGIEPNFWQTDTSVAKNSWGYVEERDYKQPAALIHDLVDIVSKNGCMLLNIGPRPDGTIPDEERAILTEIGSWLAANGEAIYGTRPWKVFGEGPTEVVPGSFHDTDRAGFTPEDFRFTSKGGAIYAIALGRPDDSKLAIRSLGGAAGLLPGKVRSVRLVSSGQELSFKPGEQALTVELPDSLGSTPALALRIDA